MTCAQPCTSTGFNGATAFQLRRSLVKETKKFTFQQLQWGRSFSAAEILENHRELLVMGGLQWGPSLAAAEMTTSQVAWASVILL